MIPAPSVLLAIRTVKTQREAACVYARALQTVPTCDRDYWSALNLAIRERWPRGLERVKREAWKIAKGEAAVSLERAGE